MRKAKLLVNTIKLGCLTALIAGCAAEQAEVRHFYWPQLPERPRIEWKKSYASQLDFPKTGFESFITGIAGEDEPVRFEKPLDIKSTGDGKVYVSDPGNSMVYVYDMVNREVHMLGRDDAVGLFRNPVGIALDPQGNLYVADPAQNSVLIFDRNEKPVRSIPMKETVERPTGLAFDAKNNHLLVVDSKGHRVFIYKPDGTLVGSFGKRGNGDGEFNYPGAITVDHQGEIVVVDTMNARVEIFDGSGKFLRKFGNRGDGPSDFQLLKGVAVDSDDDIYVTDGKASKIVIYSSKGEYLLTIGGLYSALTTGKEAPGGFVIPEGIDIDKNDTIYVVDQLNKRFQVFQYISDKYLAEHPVPGYVPPVK